MFLDFYQNLPLNINPVIFKIGFFSLGWYSIMFFLPVPVWGCLGYFFLILLLSIAKKSRQMWAVIFLVSLFFSVYSAYLGFVSYKYIRSFCLMCFISYVISFFFSYLSWIVLKRFYKINVVLSLKLDCLYLIENSKIIIKLFIPFFLF